MAALLNRAKMTTATTGTGTVTLGSASTGYLSFAEAGATDATSYAYLLEDGDDFEFGNGTYTSSGTTFSRDTVTASKISGTAGTTKLTLSGTATISIVPKVADLVGVGGALGTPSSGTLTNCTGLPVAGITASTSTALGVGSIELGHATDTTLSRTGAGDIAVEGNGIYRAGGTDVPVADGGSGRSTATAYAVLCGGTTSTGAHQSIAGVGTPGQVLTSNGASALPTFQTLTASGYTLLSTLTTTSGTTQSATSLGTKSSYLIIFNGVSGSGTGNLRIALSTNNGSSYGTAWQISGGMASAAHVYNGHAFLPGASGSTDKVLTANGYSGAASNNAICDDQYFAIDSAASAAVNALQFSWSTGSFDAGSIEVWGIA